MEKIGDLMKKIRLRGLGSGEPVMICSIWPKVISKIEPKYKKDTKAVRFWQGTLYVEICSSSEATEMQMKEWMIIEEYEKRMNNKVVKRIKWVVI